jgi:hypothetical protein
MILKILSKYTKLNVKPTPSSFNTPLSPRGQIDLSEIGPTKQHVILSASDPGEVSTAVVHTNLYTYLLVIYYIS